MTHRGIANRFQSFLKGLIVSIIEELGQKIYLVMVMATLFIGRLIKRLKRFLISFIILLFLKVILLGRKIGQRRSTITTWVHRLVLRRNLLFKIICLKGLYIKRKIVNFVQK